MSMAQIFSEFLDNLRIDNADKISIRYGEITSSLNKYFRDNESKTANTLQVGSYGRHTGIKGISDLDMIYIMPNATWDSYKNNQSKLLTDVKNAVLTRYPSTNIYVDRLVVCVKYKDFTIEIQPVYECIDEDGKKQFRYPDTYQGGSWKITKPLHEIQAMREFTQQKNKNLRRLCKMARAWKDRQGVNIGGLLIDTLAYNFLKTSSYYEDKYFSHYQFLSRDFFHYLANEEEKEYYLALGSNQRVKVKSKFQIKAKKAYNLSMEAIELGETEEANIKWREIYGKRFPNHFTAYNECLSSSLTFDNTEEFIEDLYKIDIKYDLEIDCDVSQKGFREHSLIYMLLNHIPLLRNKNLNFKIMRCTVPPPFEVKWKVLNRGYESKRLNKIRGQIIEGSTDNSRVEYTQFRGNHIVECYAIKNNIVVARASIDVPIRIN